MLVLENIFYIAIGVSGDIPYMLLCNIPDVCLQMSGIYCAFAACYVRYQSLAYFDVSDICTSTPKYVNGLLDSWTDSDFRQEAVIRHLGGTLPFKLTIGSTELPEHKGVLGANPDEKYTVTGWNKDTHNISVRVKQSGSETVYNTLGFPKAGEAPMIIAVEPTVDWMEERTSVPESWFIIPSE